MFRTEQVQNLDTTPGHSATLLTLIKRWVSHGWRKATRGESMREKGRHVFSPFDLVLQDTVHASFFSAAKKAPVPQRHQCLLQAALSSDNLFGGDTDPKHGCARRTN